MAVGAVAAALLLVGGLGALQAMAIAAALPFAAVLVAMIVGLMLALRKEVAAMAPARNRQAGEKLR
jgi:choline/glycine/proline betaine transport protein